MNESALSECIGEIKTNIDWIKESIIRIERTKANKWVEKTQWLIISGVGLWTINQLLGLIHTANALFTQ